jgi:hypothetical protein
VGTLVLAGMAVSSVVFVCFYRLVGQAADSLPLLWAVAVLAGVGLSPAFPRRSGRAGTAVAASFLVLLSAWTVAGAGPVRVARDRVDATGYLAELDLASFPAGAVMVSPTWAPRFPITYAKNVINGRDDIAVLSPRRWEGSRAHLGNRPVYFVTHGDVPEGVCLEPFRNVWRLIPNQERWR